MKLRGMLVSGGGLHHADGEGGGQGRGQDLRPRGQDVQGGQRRLGVDRQLQDRCRSATRRSPTRPWRSARPATTSTTC
ncbi:MAG: hypothetical protein WDN45_04650 [Caulobacteraceae bacterium]